MASSPRTRIADWSEVDKIVVGVVGCGYWGSKHLRVLASLPGVSVAAIDENRHRLESVRTAHDIATYESLEGAIDDLDAVVIATPPRSHAALATFALEHGVHVLVEKPLATSSAEVARLVELSERVGRVLMVGHTFEYNSVVRHLCHLIEDGVLGDVLYLDTARLNLGLYQHDVNVVWDLAVHDISIANYLLRRSPVSVSAWGFRHMHRSLEDVAYLCLAYENPDVNVHVHVSWLDPAKVRRVTVVGSRQMAVYNDLLSEDRLRIFDKGLDIPQPFENLDVAPLTYRYGDIVSPHIDVPEPLYVEDAHFLDCIRTAERPLTDGRNGGAVVAVLEAVERSIRSGGSVDVEVPATFAADIVVLA